jgi:hypothetical protein
MCVKKCGTKRRLCVPKEGFMCTKRGFKCTLRVFMDGKGCFLENSLLSPRNSYPGRRHILRCCVHGTARYHAFFSSIGIFPAGNVFGVQSQTEHLLSITHFGNCSPRRLNSSFNSCTEYINFHPEQRKHFLKNRRLHRAIHLSVSSIRQPFG